MAEIYLYLGMCVLECPIVKHFHQFLYTFMVCSHRYDVYHNCCTPLFSMAGLRLTSICVHMYNSITTTDVVRSEEVHLFKATVQ